MGALPDLPRQAPDLARRLEATVWPRLPAGESWANGPPMPALQRHVYGWRRWLEQPTPAAMGQHETVQDVHVARFTGTGRVPVLLLHGWPTSFLAFHRVVEPLRATASEVVLASLPGFGTTPLPSQRWSATDSAALLADVMARLGHDRFVVHGQDWGSVVAREMGAHAPHRVIAVHVSAGLRGFIADGSTTDAAWTRLRRFAVDGTGYLQLQSRRPDSLAFALADSPAGLLAWQLDKYHLWQPDLGGHFGLGTDFIYANATLYWLTRTAASSMRMYSANRDTQAAAVSRVPTGVSVFGSGDYASNPVSARENTLVAWREHPTGGHVAALDAPAQFVADLTDLIHRTKNPQ